MSSNQQLPLLLFPTPSRTDRETRNPYIPQIQYPSATRQGQRLGPKFNTLQNAFNSQRLQLQGATPQDNPELVLVLETVGPISSFVGAVKRISGLEWLLEADEFIDADDDFYDRTHVEQALSGNLFLLGTNQQALVEIIALWQRYQENPSAKFERGFNAWKSVFEHLPGMPSTVQHAYGFNPRVMHLEHQGPITNGDTFKEARCSMRFWKERMPSLL